jgi:hypothetical protein
MNFEHVFYSYLITQIIVERTKCQMMNSKVKIPKFFLWTEVCIKFIHASNMIALENASLFSVLYTWNQLARRMFGASIFTNVRLFCWRLDHCCSFRMSQSKLEWQGYQNLFHAACWGSCDTTPQTKPPEKVKGIGSPPAGEVWTKPHGYRHKRAADDVGFHPIGNRAW